MASLDCRKSSHTWSSQKLRPQTQKMTPDLTLSPSKKELNSLHVLESFAKEVWSPIFIHIHKYTYISVCPFHKKKILTVALTENMLNLKK